MQVFTEASSLESRVPIVDAEVAVLPEPIERPDEALRVDTLRALAALSEDAALLAEGARCAEDATLRADDAALRADTAP